MLQTSRCLNFQFWSPFGGSRCHFFHIIWLEILLGNERFWPIWTIPIPNQRKCSSINSKENWALNSLYNYHQEFSRTFNLCLRNFSSYTEASTVQSIIWKILSFAGVVFAWGNLRSKRSCCKSHHANMCFTLNVFIIGCTQTQHVHFVDLLSSPPPNLIIWPNLVDMRHP